MKTRYLLLALLFGAVGYAYAQEYDDIYYSEAKQTKPRISKGVSQPNSYYVPDMHAVDIDAYNRRGESYYATPADTIGANAASMQDYQYTQLIQQYYNPTIVIDNSTLLNEVLNGSYGNVNVVYTGLTPYFLPSYRFYYNSNAWTYDLCLSPFFWDPWRWSFYYSPWYNGGFGWWGPYYAYSRPYWGPSLWGWGWNGGWGWERPHHWMANHYRPGMHNNGYVRPGWSDNTRPGYGNGTTAHRPGTSTRPGTVGGGGTTHRPGQSVNHEYGTVTTRPSVNANDRHPGGFTGPTVAGNGTTHRPSAATPQTTYRPGTTTGTVNTRPGNVNAGATPGTSTQGRNPYTINYGGGSYQGTATTTRPGTATTRPYDRYAAPANTNTSRPGYNTTRPNTNTTRPSYNTTRPNTNTSRPSYNTSQPSYNTSRPSMNTSRPSYSGGGGGSHRSYGGGGGHSGGGRGHR